MSRRIASYMRTYRMAMGLTQAELGLLVGVSPDVIGRCERGTSQPKPAVLLGCVYLFEKAAVDLFPRLHVQVLEQIQRGAVACDELWRHRTDPEALKKLAFIGRLKDLYPEDV